MAVNHHDIELVCTRSCDNKSPDRLASAKRQERRFLVFYLFYRVDVLDFLCEMIERDGYLK